MSLRQDDLQKHWAVLSIKFRMIGTDIGTVAVSPYRRSELGINQSQRCAAMQVLALLLFASAASLGEQNVFCQFDNTIFIPIEERTRS